MAMFAQARAGLLSNFTATNEYINHHPILHCSSFGLSSPLVFSSFAARMSCGSAHHDGGTAESDAVTGQKRGRPSALQMGPRKKLSV